MTAQMPDHKNENRAENLTRLLDRIGRMARGLQYCHGLNPAQWDSLRFIARANRFSRTPGALAAVLGTTKGTASQTLNALEKKGYLTRVPDPDDRRVRHLEITEQGAALLADDPLNCLERAIARLPDDLSAAFEDSLTRIGIDMQMRCGAQQDLGICEKCGHFEGPTEAGTMRCGLKQATLTCEDAERYCVNFTRGGDGCA